MRTEPLDEEDLKNLDVIIIKFSELWAKQMGPVIPPKYDTLVMHCTDVVRNCNGYCGAFSEQSIERIHNQVNQESRTAHGIQNRAKKAEYLLKVTIFLL